jgi:hypothetical protein
MLTTTTLELPRILIRAASQKSQPIVLPVRLDRIAVRQEAALAMDVMFVIGLLLIAATFLAGIAL